MKKELLIVLLVFFVLINTFTVYAEQSDSLFEENKLRYSRYTNYPAVLKYFLREDHIVSDWNVPEIISLAKSITSGYKADYEKSKAIYYWVCSNVLEYGLKTPEKTRDNSMLAILDRGAQPSEFTFITVALHRAAGIPARVEVYGSQLSPIFFNSAYVDGKWIIMDTSAGNLDAREYANGSFIYNPTDRYFDIPLEFLGKRKLYDWYIAYSKSDYFSYNEKPKIIEIPEGYNFISVHEFKSNKHIEKVVFPKTMEEIGYFSNSTNLKEIVIPSDSNLETIADSAFEMCTSLEEVHLPDSVTSIGHNAFAGCESLKRITIPSSVTSISDNAFAEIEYNTLTYSNKEKKMLSINYKHKPKDFVIIGEKDSYAHNYAQKHKIKFEALLARSSNSQVLLNNKLVAFESYTIDGYNYFKLRDLAAALNGTEKQFDITFDSSKNAIKLVLNKPYTILGGELVVGDKSNKYYTTNKSKIYINDIDANLKSYTINGNNYFKIRDIAKVLDINISYDSSNIRIIVDTTNNYIE